ncbi:hypothetical protein L7F22_060754 [Adiantum nelumboides]|nr:hypothetical protein [Adiantum nelumboides]
MAVQKKAWMTGELFKAWLKHFENAIMNDTGKENRHLLILDGHGSHVSLDVVAKVKTLGIDIVTLPAHRSHKLQPLDVAVFKSSKAHFLRERAIWQHRTASTQASKSELASIAVRALSSLLTEANIKSGFRATGIWPLDATAIDFEKMPCKHIKIVAETTAIDDNASQVPCTPLQGNIEDEAAFVLNAMAREHLGEDGSISSLPRDLLPLLPFTRMMDEDIFLAYDNLGIFPMGVLSDHHEENNTGNQLQSDANQKEHVYNESELLSLMTSTNQSEHNSSAMQRERVSSESELLSHMARAIDTNQWQHVPSTNQRYHVSTESGLLNCMASTNHKEHVSSANQREHVSSESELLGHMARTSNTNSERACYY